MMVSNILITRYSYLLVLSICYTLLSAGCGQSRGFALPEGNIEKGQAAFTKFNCNDCHSIGDIEFVGNDDQLHVPLGGETTKLKTYGELVTSVINPTHKVAKRYQSVIESGAQMKIYNEVMTVQELVNIVTYLQSEYQFVVPETHYPYY